MILEFRDVTGTKKGFHLQHITFALEEGYLMGLSGKNGAGKSTLIKYIIDARMGYEGQILVCGENIRENRKKLMNYIGYIADDNRFIKELSAQENVWILQELYDSWSQEQYETVMISTGVPTRTPLENLSRGEFLKFQLAFAMGHGTKLYLIDEATAGMDIVFRRDFFRILRSLIRDETASVIMTSHIKEELDIQMDYMLRLDKGRMVSFGENIQED